MVEQAFVTSLIKSDGSILPFFERPVSAVLAASTIAAFRLAGVRVGEAEDGGCEASGGGGEVAPPMRRGASSAPASSLQGGRRASARARG
jgi:hypothetical protein